MTTEELRERLIAAGHELSKQRPIFTLAHTIVNLGQELLELNKVIEPMVPEQILNEVTILRNGTIEFLAAIKKISSGPVFVDIQMLKEDFKLDSTKSEHYSFLHSGIIDAVDAFETRYERFIKSDDLPAAIGLIIASSELLSIQSNTVGMIENVVSLLESETTPSPDEEEIKIVFFSNNSLKEFYKRLELLDELYEEICNVLNISTSQYPLRIRKIESGSEFIALFGAAVVIRLLSSLLKESALYFYRNFTREGKIGVIPKQIETADTILGFTEKLKNQGIDVKESEHMISKAIHSIASNFNELVSRESKIRINDETISAGNDLEQRYLDVANKSLIGAGNGDPNMSEHQGDSDDSAS